MTFNLTITMKDRKVLVNEFRLSTMLRAKSRNITNGSGKIVSVLITDKLSIATKHHTDHKDAITLLVVKETQNVDDGVIATFPDEIEGNLLSALNRVHDYGHSRGIGVRIR